MMKMRGSYTEVMFPPRVRVYKLPQALRRIPRHFSYRIPDESRCSRVCTVNGKSTNRGDWSVIAVGVCASIGVATSLRIRVSCASAQCLESAVMSDRQER